MQLSYTIWQETRDGLFDPIARSPAGITTSERAREDAGDIVLKHRLTGIMLTIEAEDATVLEEWRWRRGRWRQIGAQGSR